MFCVAMLYYTISLRNGVIRYCFDCVFCWIDFQKVRSCLFYTILPCSSIIRYRHSLGLYDIAAVVCYTVSLQFCLIRYCNVNELFHIQGIALRLIELYSNAPIPCNTVLCPRCIHHPQILLPYCLRCICCSVLSCMLICILLYS